MRYLQAVILKELRTILRTRKAFSALLLILFVSGVSVWIFWLEEANRVGLTGRMQVHLGLF